LTLNSPLFRAKPGARATGLLEGAAAQALALVPLVVGLVLGAVMLPRSVAPTEVPLPTLDARELARVVDGDDARVARVRSAPLSSRVRAAGSGLRAFNVAEASRQDGTTISVAREQIIAAVRDVDDGDVEALLDLRALQMSEFLAEVRGFERTGVVSAELEALGGTFVDRMKKVGWCDGHHILMPELVQRVAFKMTWNHTLLLDDNRRFTLTLDELRALYAFFLAHPHPAESERSRIDIAIATSPDQAACERAYEFEQKATATWLLGKVGELGKIDPTYPAPLGRAAALFMKRDYSGAAALYEGWLQDHPSGTWTLRVQNHLRAALLAADKAI
jgi:hypothetical protein